MTLFSLLLVHAIITFVAGVVLIVAPTVIPDTLGIQVQPSAYLLCYLLGAAEIALAFLSFMARSLRDGSALRLVALTFIVFHLATGAVEVLAFAQGVDAKIWGNIALRLLISLLFFYQGIYKTPTGPRLPT